MQQEGLSSCSSRTATGGGGGGGGGGHGATALAAVERCWEEAAAAAAGAVVIHILGVDHREGSTVEGLLHTFQDLLRGLEKRGFALARLVLVGPNMPHSLKGMSAKVRIPDSSLECSLNCREGLYHELQSELGQEAPADFVFLFNAGVWGYDSWIPTLETIFAAPSCPYVIITSYSQEEAEDDEDTLRAVACRAGIMMWKWTPEANRNKAAQSRYYQQASSVTSTPKTASMACQVRL